MTPLTACVVDDEPLARAHLVRLLSAHGVEIVGEAAHVAEALESVEERHPDILFLDIQMPGLTGIQMAHALKQMDNAPLIIFVTGYSEHALDAFENNAMDYLLKPVAEERLVQSLLRARKQIAIQRGHDSGVLPTAEGDLVKLGAPIQSEKEETLRWLPVREDYSIRLLRVEEIVCAVAREKRVYVMTADTEHRTYYTLTKLEHLLPLETFFRIHDSCIVNLNFVKCLHFLGNHDYEISLSDGRLFPVGRTRYAALQQRLGIST